MKQILKKTVTFFLVLALLNSVMGCSYGLMTVYAETYEDDEERQYDINMKDIEDIVYSFIHNSINFSENKWTNCTIGSEKALFDSDDSISAYYIELMKKGIKCGYIILEARAPWNIIEYSYDDESFLEIAEEKVEEDYDIDENKQKMYYLGGMSYAVSGKNNDGEKIYVDVSTNNMEKMSKKRILM